MSGVTGTSSARNPWLTAAAWRRLFRDQPLIPLIGLLVLLVALVWLVKPDSVNPGWASGIVRSAIPLALLAGCQTLTFLTGGIDLSVGAVASMSGFVVATLVGGQGLVVALIVALVIAALAGLLTGIGVGVFKVHPLIMTLGMSLVILGLANVWQIVMVQTGAGVPALLRTLGSGTFLGVLPNSLLVFLPLVAFILLLLRRTGYGRLLYAVGDNPIAARLAGTKSWQVLLVLYMISALIAAIAGFLYTGLNNVASVTLVDSAVLPSVAAAVIGGTSIMGGRGGYGGTLVGALILTVLTSLLTTLGLPEALRQILFGSIIVDRRGRLHPGHGGVLIDVGDGPPTSRHLGLDLGGTNIKWVVVERDAGEWRVLDRGQVATPMPKDRTPSCRDSQPSGPRRSSAARASRRSASGYPACTTRLPARRGSWSTSRGAGPACPWRARSARRWGCRRR